MSWLTGGLGLSLLLAICSVHNWQAAPHTNTTHSQGTEQLDLNNIMEMATKYLGKDGVEQILSGDFSKLEEVGQQFFGENNGELINNIISALPEGSFGRKLEDMKRNVDTQI